MTSFVTTLVKWSLAGTFLLLALHAQAQTITPPIKAPEDLSVGNDPTKGTSTGSDGKTLFCAENANFTLVSSTMDANGARYITYDWKEMQSDGTFAAVPNGTPDGTNPNKFLITNATPGWHTYQVTVSVSAAYCPADPVLFTVYVLPKLTITAQTTKPDANALTYCTQTGAPTGSNAIVFNSTTAFETTPNAITGLPVLTVGDFELKYTWYKVDTIAATRTQVQTGTGTSYTVTDAANAAVAGAQYKYEVEVAYSAKSCSPYKATATLNDGITTAVVLVTPKPGKPTITIQ